MIARARYYLSLLSPDVAAGYVRVPRAKPIDPADSLAAAINWICRAQDAGGDGGVARSYALVYQPYFDRQGWFGSYPETTGYIIPTMFDYARKTGRHDVYERAVRMTDWECDIQMANGAVMGGTVDAKPSPAVFNTGQVLFGWIRAYQETGRQRYLDASVRAGDFLVSVQDADGAWRKALGEFASAAMSSYTYNTRTAWGLHLVGEIAGRKDFQEAAARNVEHSLTQQLPNGWFRNNCLSDSTQPLVHTIAYALRGVLEVGIARNDARFIAAAQRGADGILARQRADGSLAGRYNERWEATVDFSCLTGNAQMGTVWGRLYGLTRDVKYRQALERVNRYLRTVQWMGTGNSALDGAISGSFPLHGGYNAFQVLNWAVKFFADSLMFEEALAGEPRLVQFGAEKAIAPMRASA